MKFLGIDYGTKRVGAALSDDDGKIAFPYAVFANDKKLLESIKKLCSDEGVGAVVVGESLDLQGRPNPVHTDAKSFAKDFAEATRLPIYWKSEFMTSHHAAIGNKKGEFKKGVVDASAAALILQRFLDKKNNK